MNRISILLINFMASNLFIPAHALAHGVGEHGAEETHSHIGLVEVLIGLGIIGALALAWALLTGRKH